MRILVFHRKDISHPYAGGSEKLLHHLMKQMTLLGYHVTWFCSGYNAAKERDWIDGVEVIRATGGLLTYLFAAYFYIKNRQRINLVLDSILGVPWFTPLYCSKTKLAVVYHLEGKSIPMIELSKTRGFLGYLMAPLVYLAERAIPILYRNTPFLTFSQDTKNDLVSSGIPARFINVAQEGINLNKYRKGEQKDFYPHVVCIGRLVETKSIRHVVIALKEVSKRIPSVQLSIIGRGYLKNDLRRLAGNLGLGDHMVFHGYVSEEEKIEILQKAHVLVMPSLREGWATPVIEAAACGTPAIGANVIGVRNTIVNGVTGYLFRFGDVKELAQTIVRILTNDELRSGMGDNVIEWAKNFPIESTIRKGTEVIKSMAEIHPSF